MEINNSDYFIYPSIKKNRLMEFIIHRVNTMHLLSSIPNKFGCEVDIRSDGSNLVLNHDPMKGGELLSDFLDSYNKGTLVLNIKESGIEDIVLEEVRKRGIPNYFLLDVEFPYLFEASLKGEKNIALRFSEKEPLENINMFKNKFDYVWIDTITKIPVNNQNKLILSSFKSCLVCPSRWGRSKDITMIKNYFDNINFKPNMIMTEAKFINKWGF